MVLSMKYILPLIVIGLFITLLNDYDQFRNIASKLFESPRTILVCLAVSFFITALGENVIGIADNDNDDDIEAAALFVNNRDALNNIAFMI